jgi:hypothetical protein
MELPARFSATLRWPGAAVWIAAAVVAYGLVVLLPFARHSSPTCTLPPGQGPYKVVFGRFSSQGAADALAARATAVGFKGLTVQADDCSRWEVALYRIPSAEVGKSIQQEARSARLNVSVQPVGG